MVVVELILLIYFAYVGGYALFFSLAALFYTSPRIKVSFRYFSFCVLIPAYKEDDVILEVVHKTIEQAYPKEKLQVVVIADRLRTETLEKLCTLPVRVINVQF